MNLEVTILAAAAAAKSLQLCPTLCSPIDGSPPGSSVPGILQARTLEWASISFSSAWKWKVKVKSLSRVRLFTTQWAAAYQAPPPMGFSRQEHWSGVPLPSPSLFLDVTNRTVHPQHVLLFSSFSWPLISWNSLEKLAPSLTFTAGSFSAAQLELNSWNQNNTLGGKSPLWLFSLVKQGISLENRCTLEKGENYLAF